MYKFWNFFLERRSFSTLIIAALVLFGAYSIVSIPKESAPEVQVPIGIVSTVLPNANSADVEKLVTNKLETALQSGLENVKEITSESREGISVVVVEFNASADIDSSIRDLRDEVDKAKSELPDDAKEPIVSEINFADQPIMTISLLGNLPIDKLTSASTFFEDELEKVNGVSKVVAGGVRDREVSVVVRQESLATYNLTILDVINAISSSNITFPIGNLSIDNNDYSIKFDGDIEDTSSIADIAIKNVGGQVLYIRDVADVFDGLSKTTSESRVSIAGAPAKTALSFSVFKRSGSDITQVTKEVRKKLKELKTEPKLEGLNTLVIFDSGELVGEDLRTLSTSGLETIVLVLLLLLLTIGWHEAIIASLAIPLSFLVGFIGLYATGNTLNFVSLFSLILSIGVLVDSAIVVVEGVHTRMKTMGDKKAAAKQTLKDYSNPLISGTFTTIAVFAPLFLVSGVTGEFIATIPFTIISVLLASLLVALGILPLISSTFLHRRSTNKMEEYQEKYTNKLTDWYRERLNDILGNKKKEKRFFWGIIILLVVALALPVTGLVKVIFFAQENSDYIYVETELPQGSSLALSDIEARKIEEVLYKDPRIDSFVTTIGQPSQFGTESGGNDPKYANIQINLNKHRKQTSTEIVDSLRKKFENIKSADVRIFQPTDGPPTSKPIVVQIESDDDADRDTAANQVVTALFNNPDVIDVITPLRETSGEFVLSVDRAKAIKLGLDPRTIALILNASVSGAKATTISNTDNDIDIVVKANLNSNFTDGHDTNKATIDAIRNAPVETPKGTILLGSILDETYQKGSSTIRHTDGKRLVTVSADVVDTANVYQVVGQVKKEVKALSVPKSVKISFAGENEDNNKSFAEMGLSLIVGLVAMLAILVLQFNSYRYALYVLSIVPFSLIGVMFGLLITGKPVSFPSVMGIIALTGIVVNNSIILIDVINKLRKSHPEKSVREIVIEGAVSRLRPILLTAVTTVIGVAPLIFASELWGPLAYAIMFGLSWSVVVTLLLIPIIYHKWPGKIN